MTVNTDPIPLDDDPEAVRVAGAFLAGYASPATRRAYRVDLRYWFAFCHCHRLHPYQGIRRTHLELYLRELEQLTPKPANTTRYRRVATLSAWFGWLEDEDLNVGNAAARIRRPLRHRRPMPWLDRNQLTDLLAAAEVEGGAVYATVCLLGLNGLRVAEACAADIEDLTGTAYQPMLHIIGKGDRPADIVVNPRTHQALDAAVAGRTTGPILVNAWGNRMRRHNVAAMLVRLAKTADIDVHITPHALRRSYITIGLLQGVSLRDMQRAARHAKADTTVGYDQSDQSFHRDPTFVLMSATSR
ncbi:tyrosine-type recombinase/integrase [Salsipaludibacter albus]|uniref:tyrosine-type recombinase/integrase n=1 Tax=Salsipaludibacter albus TaxID=2849650 RepID=UPI001EE45668|nr:tyrosine-type recombinase/integrase [Salsipaludibacter albus]MBY5163578.1 tyrosine-type recombinase/integrase [Salsipaludibacter albus]